MFLRNVSIRYVPIGTHWHTAICNMATALNTTTDYLICGKEGTDSFEDTYRLVARGSSGMSLDQKMKLIKELTKNE